MFKKLLCLVVLICVTTLGVCAKKLTYTNDGVGVLKYGAKISELPAKVDGMYDRIESIHDDFDGSTRNYFYLGEKLQYEVTWDDVIVNISVYDTNVDFGGFSVGDPMTKILAMNPVYELMNDGMNLSINGCYLWLTGFTKSGEDKADRAYANLEEIRYDENDFEESATLYAVNVTQMDEAEIATMTPATAIPAASGKSFKEDVSENWIEVLVIVAFLLVYLGMGIHMFSVYKKCGSQRVFTGSYWRMVLFALLTSGPIWNEQWVLAIFGNGMLIPAVLVVYYYACKTPMVVINKRGYVRNSQAWNSLWGNVTNRKINKAYVNQLTKQYNEQVSRYNNAPSDSSRIEMERMEGKIRSIDSDITEAKYGHFDSYVNLMIFIFVGLVYIYLTPITMIFSYLKNYVYYNSRKVEKMEQKY